MHFRVLSSYCSTQGGVSASTAKYRILFSFNCIVRRCYWAKLIPTNVFINVKYPLAKTYAISSNSHETGSTKTRSISIVCTLSLKVTFLTFLSSSERFTGQINNDTAKKASNARYDIYQIFNTNLKVNVHYLQ